MSRFTFFGPFMIGCAVAAFSGVLPQHASAQTEGSSGGYGAEMGGPFAEEQRFQRGIRRVVKSLEQAETEEEKQRLLELGRRGLEWRYQSKLDARKRELEKLRQRLEQLEDDYARRTQAMPRVINLQLESLKLASEGLINLEGVLGRQTSMGYGGVARNGGGGRNGDDGRLRWRLRHGGRWTRNGDGGVARQSADQAG